MNSATQNGKYSIQQKLIQLDTIQFILALIDAKIAVVPPHVTGL